MPCAANFKRVGDRECDLSRSHRASNSAEGGQRRTPAPAMAGPHTSQSGSIGQAIMRGTERPTSPDHDSDCRHEKTRRSILSLIIYGIVAGLVTGFVLVLYLKHII
jgi:hypothetical protein